MPIGVQGNPRPGAMVYEWDVHSSFHCSQPFYSPFRCSWWYGRSQNKATTRRPGFCVGDSVALNSLPLIIIISVYLRLFTWRTDQGSVLFGAWLAFVSCVY